MSTSTIAQRIEDFASDVYLKDTTGENFIENIVNTTHLKSLLQRLLPQDLDEPILEMGFGEGTITGPLLDAGYRVEIVEGSAQLCENARRRFANRGLVAHCSYFENFKPSKQYRNVLSLHVLEHVDNPADVISKMMDWVAPGGQVIAIVPNADSLHRQLAVMMGLQEKNDSLSPRDIQVGHQRVFTLAQLVQHFQAAGFEIIDQFGYFLKIVPNGMMTSWPHDLIRSLTEISNQIPAHLLANTGLVARKKP